MGQLKGATLNIISRRIGDGGVKLHDDVRRVNELLRLAGYLKGSSPTMDRVWTDATAKALLPLIELMRRMNGPGDAAYGKSYTGAFLDPVLHKSLLYFLASEAGVLINLPHRKKGKEAITEFFDYCRKKNIPYRWKAVNRMVWGLDGFAHVGIATCNDKFFPGGDSVGLNCTSFANLMLSIWIWGNAHQQPYDASQMVGGYDPLSDRFNMHAVHHGIIHEGFVWFEKDKDYKSVRQAYDAITAAVHPDRLYFVASCEKQSALSTHDMVLFNGEVYQCNEHVHPAVYKTPLLDHLKKMANAGRILYLAGPSTA